MNTIDGLKKLDKETKANVYITGGFVRDFIRKKINKDLDIVISGIELEEAQKFLSDIGKVKIVQIHRVEGTDPVIVLMYQGVDGVEAQLTSAKGKIRQDKKGMVGPKTILKYDSNYRDFSINAMYMPVNSMTKTNILDFHGGKNDIVAKQLLTVGSAKKRFRESPIRILRAFSLAARFNYKIAAHTIEGIRECREYLYKISQEAIRLELIDIILSKKPSKYLKLMAELGVLEIVLPELYKCINCWQDKRYHKYDVFHHLIYACDSTEPELIIRLSALLHDVGKPASMNVIGSKRTFYKHEVIGSKEAAIMLKRLKFDNKTIHEVTHLIRMHMYHYTREYSDAGVRKFINNAGVRKEDLENLDNFTLFKLRRADRAGNGYRKKLTTDRQLDFEKRIVEVFNSSKGLGIKDLSIDGNDLMSVFSLTPGKQVGEILNYLLERVLEVPELNEKEQLFRLSLDYIRSKTSNTLTP